MNVMPKLVPADFKMPPPKPRREKRIIPSSNMSPSEVVKKVGLQPPSPKVQRKKSPLKKSPLKKSPGKKSPGRKGKKSKKMGVFTKAKESVSGMSNMYGNLE